MVVRVVHASTHIHTYTRTRTHAHAITKYNTILRFVSDTYIEACLPEILFKPRNAYQSLLSVWFKTSRRVNTSVSYYVN